MNNNICQLILLLYANAEEIVQVMILSSRMRKVIERTAENVMMKFPFLLCVIVIMAGMVLINNLRNSEAGLVGLSLADLLHQSELIILGNVTDKKIAMHGLLNHTLSIDKILNGTHNGNTINVFGQVPEVVEDAVDLKKVRR